ncbi:MAG: integrin alpha [Planctomycetota bacterium]
MSSLRACVTVAFGFLLVTSVRLSAQSILYQYDGRTTEYLGWSVASLGDLDGDAVRDFAFGVPGFADHDGTFWSSRGLQGARSAHSKRSITETRIDSGMSWPMPVTSTGIR